jgi:hypothetical protein
MLSKEQILSNAIKFATGQTDYQNEHFVMNSHVTGFRQIRQALLEIENRYHGIRKIKLDVRRDEVRLKKLRKDIAECEDPLEAELWQIDVEDVEVDQEIRHRKIARAEQELDIFIKKIQECVENEEDIARYFDGDPEEEEKYWVARMGKQAAMDILSFGRISVGNLDSISMLPEEQQLQILSIGFQYSNLLGGQLAKIEGKTREYTKHLLADENNLRLPTFEGIEEQMQLKLLTSLQGIVSGTKKGENPLITGNQE